MQVFPEVLPATYIETISGRKCVLGRTEVQRRERDLVRLRQTLSPQHPLVQLIESCLDNDPEDRPSAAEVLRILEDFQLEDAYRATTRLDIIRELEAMKIATDGKNLEISTLRQQVRQSLLSHC